MDGPAAELPPQSRHPRCSPLQFAGGVAVVDALRCGVAQVEPKKTLRASYRRFVYTVPNAYWQLDGAQCMLTSGLKCGILQLIDDHSRLAGAAHVAWGETSAGAITFVSEGIAEYVFCRGCSAITGPR